MKRPNTVCLMLLIVLCLVSILLAGCAVRQIDYAKSKTTNMDGTVTELVDVTYYNNGFDTSAAGMTLEWDEHGRPSITVENYSAEDAGARAVTAAADALKEVAKAMPTN